MLDSFKQKGSSPEMFDDIFFISILDPDFPDRLFNDCDNYKTWWFYDLEYEIGNYKPMNEKQAEEIYQFIKSNKDKKRCFVHCSAGISRSGAVGEFIQDILGTESYQDFKKRNPNITPNLHIKKLLNQLI